MLERWSAEYMSLSLWFLNKRAGRHDFFGLEVLEVWEERHESAEHMLLVLEVLRRGGRTHSHWIGSGNFCCWVWGTRSAEHMHRLEWIFEKRKGDTQLCNRL